jgi:glutamine amidotransferase
LKIGIVYFGMGNIESIRSAVHYIKKKSIVIDSLEKFDDVSHIILPGVGSYNNGIKNLKKLGFYEKIQEEVYNKKPILGICLGMQLLSSIGTENGVSKGLGFFENKVSKIDTNLKLPHIGWNNIEKIKDSILFKGIKDYNFYFLHSYAYESVDDYVTSICEYGTDIVASIEKDNIYGVQFHPEKSQKSGLKLLRNFLELC